jgi:hypothetical protein
MMLEMTIILNKIKILLSVLSGLYKLIEYVKYNLLILQ